MQLVSRQIAIILTSEVIIIIVNERSRTFHANRNDPNVTRFKEEKTEQRYRNNLNSSVITCYKCRQPNHFARHCTQKN